jgi:hypothetical protein
MEVEGVEDGEVWFSEGEALSRFETGPALVDSGELAGASHGYHEYHRRQQHRRVCCLALFSFLISRASPSSSCCQTT